MYVGFDMETPFPLERVNEWNSTRNSGRAFIDDEGDPYIDHPFSVSGPADEGAIYETITLWEATVINFIEFIGWGQSAGS